MSDAAPTTVPSEAGGGHEADRSEAVEGKGAAATTVTPAKDAAASDGADKSSAKKSARKKAGGFDVDEYLPNRREAIFLASGAVLGGALGFAGAKRRAGGPVVGADRDDAVELTAKEAKALLEAGNQRFVGGTPTRPEQSLLRRQVVAEGQNPFAVILSCADSRVPPEVLFDQGLGDLFVVRAAGQVVDRAVLGSVQYGVEHLETPLLVVLGHSKCGAVKATVETVQAAAKAAKAAKAAAGETETAEASADAAHATTDAAPADTAHASADTAHGGTDAAHASDSSTGTAHAPSAVEDLIAAIRPAVLEAEEIGAESGELLDVAISVNVERIVEQLKEDAVVGAASTRRAVKVVGAVYDLDTGEVDWL